MLRNYFKIAYRTLLKNKVYSLINISGLSVGIACGIIVTLFVWNELSYDTFHKNRDRIFRLYSERKFNTGEIHYGPRIRNDIADKIKGEVSEAEKIIKIGGLQLKVESSDNKFYYEGIYFAESEYFDVFSFNLLVGDEKTALTRPNTAVITKELALKFFGNINPIGEILTLDDKHDIEITGILDDIPKNTHMKNHFIVSFTSFAAILKGIDSERGLNEYSPDVYLLLHENSDINAIEARFIRVMAELYGEQVTSNYKFYLLPIEKIHLDPKGSPITGAYGNFSDIYFFSSIALLILMLACINYINLSTALGSRRAKEIGIRKITGAGKKQLINQFMLESVIITTISFILGILLTYLLIPLFNTITGVEIVLLMNKVYLLLFFILMVLILGVLAGMYPAILMSAMDSLAILKKQSVLSDNKSILKKGLVIVQYSVSIVFIIGIVVIWNQMDFIKNKELGFSQENTVIVDVNQVDYLTEHYESIKNELLKNPDITDVIGTFFYPGIHQGFEEYCELPDDPDKGSINLFHTGVGFRYFDFFNMKLIWGKGFVENNPTAKGLIINESALKLLKWEKPLGKRIKSDSHDIEGIVIGVVEDFNAGPLYNKIRPTVFTIAQESWSLCIKTMRGNEERLKENIENALNKISPGIINRYIYLDARIQRSYKEETKKSMIYKVSAAISLFLALIGSVGIASFSIETRTKEIGIRKVLGTGVNKLVGILTWEFINLILISNIIAWPVAYYLMRNWLNNFAYRIELEWWFFAVAGILVIGISLGTISFQVIKAAMKNPVDVLRYE